MSSLSTNRLGFGVIVAAALFVVIWGVRGMAGILNPILLAAVITITLLPLPNALTRRGMKSGTALLVTIILVVVTIVGLAWLILASLSQINTNLPSLTGQYQSQQAAAAADTTATTAEQLAHEVISALNARQFSSLFSGIISAVGSSIAQLFMTLLIFVFMLYTAISMPNLARLGIDIERGAAGSLIDLTADVRRYVVLTTLINLFVGIGDTILLWIVGVPFAVFWGILAWLLGFIPGVGYWLALIPPTLLAYSLFGLPTAAVVFIGYAIINGTAANIISPRVLGKGLSISPLVVFVSVFVWAWLLGGIGAILAVPLTMLILVILDSFEGTRWLAGLMRFVPGSDKEEDAAAVDHAKGIWGRVKDRLPRPSLPGSSAP